MSNARETAERNEPHTRRGLEIAREFFFGWGQPYLAKEFPEVAPRMAAGRLLGSDVLEADDEVSRDHCWGPQFWLFLSAEDYARHGERISAAANAAAPNPWKGHRLAGGGDKPVMVASIPGFIRDHVRFTKAPQTLADWTGAGYGLADQPPDLGRESTLYFIRHGAVWVDGSGELGRWRQAIGQYPPAILTQRVAEECFRVWHHGEYNFVQRMARRRDPLAIAVCLGEFVSGVMRIQLLLDGDFAPYWKWLAHEFRKRPCAATFVPLLEPLVRSTDIPEQVGLIKRICTQVHDRLLAEGWVTGKGANRWLLPLLNDHNELKARAESLRDSEG